MDDFTFDLSSFFDWNGVKIFQDDRVFKVGTDALLLGGWIPKVVQTPAQILDIGTGCGILALMLGRSFPACRIDGVDMDAPAVQLATLTAIANGAEERIRFFRHDILDASSLIQDRYDLVVSNPPFYDEGVMPMDELHRRSKHMVGSMIWLESMTRYLDADGHLCIVVPFRRAGQWIRDANALGYYVNHRLDVFTFLDDSFPVRSLLHFTHRLEKPLLERITIQHRDKRYTEPYTTLTGIRGI